MLGRQDSNLRMPESKSGDLPLVDAPENLDVTPSAKGAPGYTAEAYLVNI